MENLCVWNVVYVHEAFVLFFLKYWNHLMVDNLVCKILHLSDVTLYKKLRVSNVT